MILRALIAFLVLPGLFALALPPLLAVLDPWRGGASWLGWPVLAAGVAVLGWCVADFYLAGKGTLAPWDPPRRLVIRGLYRHTRNPMYVGVLTIVLGQALVWGSPLLGLYGVALAIGFHVRVTRVEEPWLARTFPEDWPSFAATIPRWVPRLRP